jgi:hypothetical protein
METVHYRDKIRVVAQNWHTQFRKSITDEGNSNRFNAYYKEVYDKLLLLDVETCTQDDVDKCMSRNLNPTCSWVRSFCTNCKQDVEEVILLPRCDDIQLCKNCVTEMLSKFKTSTE